jgi:tripartite-type tricarboxylate transporter receptor subunit TctC
LKRAALAALAMLAASAACAQSFPSKPVRIMSVFAAGLSPDIYLRVVADKLGRYWGQQVIVEPRPGGNGLVGINALKKAVPDGHELLLLGNVHLTMNPLLVKTPQYDAENDFVPVTYIAQAPFFMYVAGNSPYRSVADIVAAAKKDPEKIIYSTPYSGSPPHLGGAVLALQTGTKMLAVHFKEGSQINTAVVNGDVAFTITTAGSAAPMVKSGHLRTLALAAPQRSPDAPEVPTVEESGGPKGFEVEAWASLVAPRGTPIEVANRIAADIARALAEPDVRERYKALGVLPASTTPADMTRRIRTALKSNAEIVQRLGITAE